ncbi:hypothetical protein B0H16DRAFT_1313451 [Mycena metata]|uniref:Uncharacterized protein n=1 Tax=Mycena metata TaxID=1033252 RepID=A0AAD7NEV3_9AGAR|nr:hypothetical protein B0H16DRAFT_1313451 [Mycena metata]
MVYVFVLSAPSGANTDDCSDCSDICSNASSASTLLHELYLDAFEGTPDTLRMALISPQIVDGVLSSWYGAGGSSTLGYSNIPTVGIIPQPDYLWAAMVDGGWSRLDVNMVITQINVILRLIDSIDKKFAAGTGFV